MYDTSYNVSYIAQTQGSYLINTGLDIEYVPCYFNTRSLGERVLPFAIGTTTTYDVYHRNRIETFQKTHLLAVFHLQIKKHVLAISLMTSW